MSVIKFRLAEADHTKFKDADRWYTLDLDTLDDLTTGELIVIEGEMNYSIEEMVWGLRRGAAKGRCAAMWIARNQAGIVESWDEFDPLVRRAEWIEEDSAVPPAPATEASPPSPPDSNPSSAP